MKLLAVSEKLTDKYCHNGSHKKRKHRQKRIYAHHYHEHRNKLHKVYYDNGKFVGTVNYLEKL